MHAVDVSQEDVSLEVGYLSDESRYLLGNGEIKGILQIERTIHEMEVYFITNNHEIQTNIFHSYIQEETSNFLTVIIS